MQSLGVFFSAVIVLTMLVSYSQGQWVLGLAIIAALGVGFGWIVRRGARQQQVEKRVREALDQALLNEGFAEAKKLLSADFKAILAIDEASRKICLVHNDHGLSSEPTPGSIRSRIYGFHDILQSQIVEEGPRQGRVKRLSLNITTNDREHPVFSLVLIIISSLGLSKQTPFYKQAISVGNYWNDLLTELRN